MPYSSSLSDKDWETIKLLLPQKKQTPPPKWTKRQILDGIFYQFKNGCNWCDLPKDLPPYKGGVLALQAPREAGVIEQMMMTLRGKVRSGAKKTKVDNPTDR